MVPLVQRGGKSEVCQNGGGGGLNTYGVNISASMKHQHISRMVWGYCSRNLYADFICLCILKGSEHYGLRTCACGGSISIQNIGQYAHEIFTSICAKFSMYIRSVLILQR